AFVPRRTIFEAIYLPVQHILLYCTAVFLFFIFSLDNENVLFYSVRASWETKIVLQEIVTFKGVYRIVGFLRPCNRTQSKCATFFSQICVARKPSSLKSVHRFRVGYGVSRRLCFRRVYHGTCLLIILDKGGY
ncbi:unnamed protein product, partial [Ascophyllum nodosum]